MAKSKKISIARRNFLKGAAGGAAALATGQQTVQAQQAAAPPRYAAARPAPAETDPTPNVEVLTADRPGSDFMVDIIKSLGFEFIFANPGSSFRGLQESITVYGGNKSPEFITCCHEESSVAMAHGYAKIEGKPACVFAHGTVGLQHASMALYNAYCDRVPVFVVLGNLMDATSRRPGAEWNHSVQDAASMVRDFIKWDDNPASLTHFAESAVRAYKIAMTPPMLPVVLVADGDLQENAIAPDARLHIPKLAIPAPPQGDSGAVAEVAKLLVAAENPVLVAGRVARTPAGMQHLVELAEVLQAPVIDQAERMNFPTRHALNHTDRSRALIANADVIVGLELTDFWGTVNSYRDQLHRTSKPMTKSGAKLISITSVDLYTKSNYQDFQRFPEVDLAIAADAEATLPALTEEVKRLINADRKRAYQDRGAKLATAKQQAVERARTEATYAWDASPISTSRLSAEMWAQIKDKDWSVVSSVSSISNWPLRLWAFDKHYQYIGGAGGAGIGYGAPAATGAAIANRKHGRLTVNFQNDGDVMYAPGILWTSAHHKIPLLSVVHNNRAYHQELMHLQRMANRHQRGIDNCGIGTTLDNPNIDYAKIAQGMGVYAQGPITDPKDLGPALGRAVEVAMKGEPALIDVVTQPR
ncbi:MAG TPA: thiamine pyrophosphate-dependent enzyme [Bryobacteraceae bacterium]|nr:thiamine pyrophosphate-dependent enzyme [Bryobacteraceae bacterium]